MNLKYIIFIILTVVICVSMYFVYSKEKFTNSICHAPKDDTSLVIKGLYKNGHGILAPNMFESKHGDSVNLVQRDLAGLEIIPTVDKNHTLAHPWIIKTHPQSGVDTYFNPLTGVYEKHKPESLHENCFTIHS